MVVLLQPIEGLAHTEVGQLRAQAYGYLLYSGFELTHVSSDNQDISTFASKQDCSAFAQALGTACDDYGLVRSRSARAEGGIELTYSAIYRELVLALECPHPVKYESSE